MNWIFFRFHADKTGWGQDTPARVSSPPLSIFIMPCDVTLIDITKQLLYGTVTYENI